MNPAEVTAPNYIFRSMTKLLIGLSVLTIFPTLSGPRVDITLVITTRVSGISTQLPENPSGSRAVMRSRR